MARRLLDIFFTFGQNKKIKKILKIKIKKIRKNDKR